MATTVDSTVAKVWFITGCSSGFGQEIAIAALKRGDRVIATARKLDALNDLRALGCDTLALDVTDDDATIQQVVATAHALYGRIDVLVNNAGYALNGAVEEAQVDEVLDLFNTNVFGLLKVSRAVLPFLRAQKSGTVANIGSVIGHVPMAACGIYGATKAAVASLSQTMRQELAPFNIEVVVIEPSLFRTKVMAKSAWSEPSIDAYVPLIDAVKQMIPNQPMGDPVKAAALIVEALTKTGRAENRPLPNRLPLGAGTYEPVSVVLKQEEQDLNAWKDFANPELFA